MSYIAAGAVVNNSAVAVISVLQLQLYFFLYLQLKIFIAVFALKVLRHLQLTRLLQLQLSILL